MKIYKGLSENYLNPSSLPPSTEPTISVQTAILGALAAILTICIGISCACASEPINDTATVHAIIGEAENQGYEGMLAVACAIHNRGTLKGVYGLYAKRVLNYSYSQKTLELARTAYNQSLKEDITNGATHWENIGAFGKPYWINSMKETYRYKDHVFYKPSSKES